ncbi:MAG: hypothetical protein IH898_04745 [Planctomycetes bacterium]|nr:hypothetical protein [Planctomycetota bacterium]
MAFSILLVSSVPALAAVPSDRLMSLTTRGYASIGNIEELCEKWNQTQMGQLVQDEAMQPFIEDLKNQLKRKITGLRDKLGIEWSDLRDVAGGEIGLGLVERENDRAAIALVVDVTGHRSEMNALLVKVGKELSKRGATKETIDVSGTGMTTYTIPAKGEKNIERTVVFFVKDNMLCASDSRLEAEEMLRRFDGAAGSRLVDAKPYQVTMGRCRKESAGIVPQIRWFMDPFGYARAVRSLAPANEKIRGKDYLMILSNQGFDAVQGLGGYVSLAVGGAFELLHRTSVYAPPISGEPDKYRLAMRMMKFPNSKQLRAQSWSPRKLASYRTFNCDLANAFETFGTLFDAVAGYEDAFAGVLEGLQKDPYGPQVDVRKDFIAHLGQRVTLVTDYEVPITPKSERFLFVIEVTNEEAIAKTVKKFMESDPNVIRTRFLGKIVWEIQEAQEEIPELYIAVSDLDLLEPVEEAPADGKANKALPTSAVCVADGHLFIASHVDFLKEVFSLDTPQARLRTAGDYREVNNAMSQLLSGAAAARFFMRTDEVFRPIYELLRQGKMPESETLLGRLLNRLLTPPHDEEEGILREQKIDGRQLPDFEMVRRYFSPAGTIVRSSDDGWFIVGATLSKLAPQARADTRAEASVSTIR